MSLSDDEIDRIVTQLRSQRNGEVKEVVKETVDEVMARLGVDATNPFEMQADFRYLRELRNSKKQFQDKTTMTAVGILVAGALGALWVGVQQSLRPPM